VEKALGEKAAKDKDDVLRTRGAHAGATGAQACRDLCERHSCARKEGEKLDERARLQRDQPLL
jgi:hypothetical protein